MLGDRHPQTLVSMNNLGLLLEQRGNLAGAEALWREALQGRREVLGESHPNTVASREGLAAFLEEQGRPDEAQAVRDGTA